MAHISFTGQECEPKEASKQLWGTINQSIIATSHIWVPIESGPESSPLKFWDPLFTMEWEEQNHS